MSLSLVGNTSSYFWSQSVCADQFKYACVLAAMLFMTVIGFHRTVKEPHSKILTLGSISRNLCTAVDLDHLKCKFEVFHTGCKAVASREKFLVKYKNVYFSSLRLICGRCWNDLIGGLDPNVAYVQFLSSRKRALKSPRLSGWIVCPVKQIL